MNFDHFCARAAGIWMTLQESTLRVRRSRWLPLCYAYGGTLILTLLFTIYAPVDLQSAWWGLPLVFWLVSVGWALFWPMDCATWFGWIGMLFRLVTALALSNVVWFLAGVLR